MPVSNYILCVPDVDLGDTLKLLFKNALKCNAICTYNSAQKRYLKFCSAYDFDPCQASAEVILYYVSFLFKEGLKG
jgi:hypothetical protein